LVSNLRDFRFAAIQQAEIDVTPVNSMQLERSGWLRHLKALMDATAMIVDQIVRGDHVLVHCSDGWDRTAQLVSLAQVCLDPYYRTLEGFIVLVEKDWLGFGHKFSDRCGHLAEKDATDAAPPNTGLMQRMQARWMATAEAREISPVFHQFLDCVHQLMKAYPAAFQFEKHFLIELHLHVYSCQYGTFLGNCEAERNELLVRQKTHSVWSRFLSQKDAFLVKSLPDVPPCSVLNAKSISLHYWPELLQCTWEQLGEISASVSQPVMVSPDATSAAVGAVVDRVSALWARWTGPTADSQPEVVASNQELSRIAVNRNDTLSTSQPSVSGPNA
jgi:hypothetical protein